MVGVIWYRFVRCGGTDWSDTLVPIHPLQWYRFADIIKYHSIISKAVKSFWLTRDKQGNVLAGKH